MYEPPPDVATLICEYMNETQSEALVDIARAAGHQANHAALTDLRTEDFGLRLKTENGARDIRIPWPSPLRRREDIRAHLLELQEEARFGSF